MKNKQPNILEVSKIFEDIIDNAKNFEGSDRGFGLNDDNVYERNIDFFYARGKDKADFIPELAEKYNTTVEHMAYIGDDLFDSSMLEAVQFPFCPADACRDVKKICVSAFGYHNVLQSNGGCNVIMEMVDLMLERGLVNDCTMQDIEALDKNEKF